MNAHERRCLVMVVRGAARAAPAPDQFTPRERARIVRLLVRFALGGDRAVASEAALALIVLNEANLSAP